MNQTAYRTDVEKSLARAVWEEMPFKSNHEFLKQQNGWRNGKIHTVLGESGAGKSTFFRSVLIDLISMNDKNVLVWLSEETREEFLTAFEMVNYWNEEKLYNIKIISEMDENLEDESSAIARMDDVIANENIDIMFYDNITTSGCYMDKPVADQARVSKKMKMISKDHNIPLVIYAHTSSSYPIGTLIQQNHIRGCKSICNLSQFFYILQAVQYEMGDKKYRLSTLRLDKSRERAVKEHLFKLDYDPGKMIYETSSIISFNEFKEVFAMRNRL